MYAVDGKGSFNHGNMYHEALGTGPTGGCLRHCAGDTGCIATSHQGNFQGQLKQLLIAKIK